MNKNTMTNKNNKSLAKPTISKPIAKSILKPVAKSLLATLVLSIVLLFNNCGPGFQASNGAIDALSDGSAGGLGNLQPTSGSITISTSQAAHSTELNRILNVPIIIDRSGELANIAIELKINSENIDTQDSINGFNATITPSTLAPGENTATVQIIVGAGAPSLSELFYIEALEGSLLLTQLQMSLTIQPIIRFQVSGSAAGDANWSSNGISIQDLFTPGTRNIQLAAHSSPGLQVIFENYSSAPHSIFASGAIPQQNPAEPMAASPDGGMTVGGNYSPPPIIGTTTPSNATFYTHDVPGASRYVLTWRH